MPRTRPTWPLLAALLNLGGCAPGKAGGAPQIRSEVLVRPLASWLGEHGLAKAWVPSVLKLVEGLLIVVAFWLVAVVVSGLAWRLTRQLVRPTLPEFHDRLRELLRGPLRRAVRALGLYFASLVLPVPAWIAEVVSASLYVLIAYHVVQTLMIFLGIVTEEYLHRLDPKQAQQHRNEYVSVVRTFAGFLLVALAVVNVLNRFGWKLSSVITAFGFIGAAIGLAARDILAQLFSGLAILLDQPFHAGDRIMLSTQEIGDVLRIGSRATEIRLLHGSVVLVPNTDLINNRVVNLSTAGTSLQLKLPLSLPHGTDLEKARAAMIEVANAHPGVARSPAPLAPVVSLAEQSVGLELWCNITDPLLAQDVAHELRLALVQRFAQLGLPMALKPAAPPAGSGVFAGPA